MKLMNAAKFVQTSVIVCTKDRMNSLTNLLESLANQTIKPDEVIIVDASHNNDTKKMLDEKSGQLPYDIVYKKASPGSARQRNIGYALSRGKYLFFFDDDVVLDSGYIRIIMDTFSELERVQLGGITGRIMNVGPSLNIWESLFKRLFFLSDFGSGKIKLSGFPSLRIDNVASYVGVLSGCNMAFPKHIFSQFMFDEALTGYSYMEDVDLSFRVAKEFLLYYQPKAKLEHLTTTYKTVDTRMMRKMMARNHFYLFRKNLPKNLPNIFAFIMSIVGMLLYNGLAMKDIRACIGIVEGILKPLKLGENPEPA